MEKNKCKLKYIAFFDTNNNKSENRMFCLAATNKIDYICTALTRNNYDVEIVSPSWTNNTSGYFSSRNKQISKGISLRTFATFGAKNKIARGIRRIFSLLQLFGYLLLNTKRNEQVLVYHSISLSTTIRLAKLLKKFKIILEVEEIYQDVQSLSNLNKRKEYKIFEKSEKYILSTELLNDKINPENKPSIVLYGTYQIQDTGKRLFHDSKIHIVYAGTFDPRKGGALAAVNASKYLSNAYHMHIIGFGKEIEVKNIIEEIDKTSKMTEATISYDGLLNGKEYIQFLQSCDIGISAQIPDTSYANTSFPSKILSYLSNGLRVVTIRIKVVEISGIGNIVYYYETQDPETIAKTIMSINRDEDYDSKKTIAELDNDFKCKIQELLEA